MASQQAVPDMFRVDLIFFLQSIFAQKIILAQI